MGAMLFYASTLDGEADLAGRVPPQLLMSSNTRLVRLTLFRFWFEGEVVRGNIAWFYFHEVLSLRGMRTYVGIGLVGVYAYVGP